MDWYDVDDILIDGTESQIRKLRCPNCGGRLKYDYSGDVNAGRLIVRCTKCYTLEALHKLSKPNCVKFFGKSAIL